MKLGITQIILTGSAKDAIDIAKECGYDCVELSIKDDKGCIGADSTDEEICEVKQYADSLGIDIISTCIGAGSYNLLADGKMQQKGIEEAIKGLEVSAKLGARTMLHTLGSISSDLYYEDAYNNSINSLKEIAVVANKLKVALAIEMVWNGFLFSPIEMRNLIDEVGSDYIGFYFDPGNMAVFQYPQHWVRALGTRTKMVHFKDFKGSALNGEWTPLLSGEVNFEIVLHELKKAGVEPIFISEVDASLDSYKNTCDRMKEIGQYYK